MKIYGTPSLDKLNEYVHVRDKAVDAFTPPQGGDEAQVSSKAKTFSAVLTAVKEAGLTRTPAEQERVETIARQIQGNTYARPGVSVADRLLEK